MHTNLTLSGAVAQYGRGVGIIQMTAAAIITQFANNLKAQLGRDEAVPVHDRDAGSPANPDSSALAAPSAAPSTAELEGGHKQESAPAAGPMAAVAAAASSPASPSPQPISGFALLGAVAWQWLKRLFWRG